MHRQWAFASLAGIRSHVWLMESRSILADAEDLFVLSQRPEDRNRVAPVASMLFARRAVRRVHLVFRQR
jgi:hypothetical protein